MAKNYINLGAEVSVRFINTMKKLYKTILAVKAIVSFLIWLYLQLKQSGIL